MVSYLIEEFTKYVFMPGNLIRRWKSETRKVAASTNTKPWYTRWKVRKDDYQEVIQIVCGNAKCSILTHVYMCIFDFVHPYDKKKAHQPFEKSKRSGYTKVWFSVKKYVVILFAMFPNINVHLNLQNDTDFI